MLDINQIRDILPHRYPMLLVDRIVEVADDRIVGLKNVSANEPFFQGHFPCYPVMPGVLIVETMAQVGAVLLLRSVEQRDNKLVLFTTIEQAKFRRPVVPGDQLRVEMQVLKRKATVCKMSGKVTVDGKLVAEAVLMCQLADRPAPEPPAPSSGS
jgi:3-hydroxyacyl-[acyl-carrier-protein] dehydratase